MIACSISIYALKNKKRISTFVFLVLAALFHRTFWALFVMVYLSKFIKFTEIKMEMLLILLFIVICCTNIIEIILFKLALVFPISIGNGYFVFIRRIGPVVFIRYIFMFLFWVALYKMINNTTQFLGLFNILFLSLFTLEFIGVRLLVFSSRFPQTFYAFFFIPFTEKTSYKIDSMICCKYNLHKFFLITSIALSLFILFVQLLTGEHLNNVLPYRSILFI